MTRQILQVCLILAALSLLTEPGHGIQITSEQRAEIRAHVSPDQIQADTDGNGLFDDLEFTLAHARPDQPVDVIVRYKRGHEPAAVRLADRVSRALPLDRSVAARLTGAQIHGLMASGDVESIESNALCYGGRASSQASLGITKARTDFGYTGDLDSNPNRYSTDDIVIAVIDTGIDAAHPDFPAGKIVGWKDFVNNRAQPYDDHGHGTFCASIAAGAVNSVGGIRVGGVAPGAALVAVKVLNEQNSARMDTAIAGIDWCIENRERYQINVINFSISGRASSDGTDAESRAVDRAVAAGMVVCVAAANYGPGRYTIPSPAAARGAITVGNMVDAGKGGYALYISSGRGPTLDGRVKPDVCAPGAYILAANANHGNYTYGTGTSFATPFVAGLAALILQANLRLTPAQVKAILKETAVPFGRSLQTGLMGFFSGGGENSDYGAGRVDGYAALIKASGKSGTPPPVPQHLFAAGYLPGPAQTQFWLVPIQDTRFAMAVTLIADDADSDFDLELLDPNGAILVDDDGNPLTSATSLRQETLLFHPGTVGTYLIKVLSYGLGGSYTLDVSAGTSAVGGGTTGLSRGQGGPPRRGDSPVKGRLR